MCQTLGYHREVAADPETSEQRQRRVRLVRSIICMDKSLSLRLGRPSTIRDSDFTLNRLDTEHDRSVSFYGTILPKWIDWSLLQGRVFDDIFSPVALMQPESIRVSRAKALATELQMVFDSMSPLEARYLEERRRALGDTMHELLNRADKVNHLSTMALIYRGIPSGPRSGSAFCEECVDVAHQALDEHKSCIELLRGLEGSIVGLYVQWYVSFFISCLQWSLGSEARRISELLLTTLPYLGPFFPPLSFRSLSCSVESLKRQILSILKSSHPLSRCFSSFRKVFRKRTKGSSKSSNSCMRSAAILSSRTVAGSK